VKFLEEAAVSDQESADNHAGFGALETDRGRLPLVAMDVHARLSGLFAEMTLPGFPNAVRLSLEVEIEPGGLDLVGPNGALSVRSSLHERAPR